MYSQSDDARLSKNVQTRSIFLWKLDDVLWSQSSSHFKNVSSHCESIQSWRKNVDTGNAPPLENTFLVGASGILI